MYKVLFADDEILTREAIATNTPWGEAGFTLVGAAENGKEAIRMMEQDKPDLLITDICMPIMDGIELSGYVKIHYPDMQVMIVSGYDEFEYAKQALKNGVSEYILKPITSCELKEELLKFKDKIDLFYERKYHTEKMEYVYEKSVPVIKEHFLNRLLEGNIPKERVEERLDYFGIYMKGRYQAVTFIETDDMTEFERTYPEMPKDLISFAIANIANEVLEEENAITFQNANDTSIIIYAAEDEETLQHSIQRNGKKIRDAVLKSVKTKVCVVVGETVHSGKEWKKSYDSARHAEKFKYLSEEAEFLYGKEYYVNHRKTNDTQKPDSWTEKLLLLIKTNQKEKLEDEVEELFCELRNTKCEKQETCLQIQNYILSIVITLEEEGMELPQYTKQEMLFINHLHTYEKMSEIKDEFRQFCLNITKAIAEKRESSNQTIAELAIDYVNKNYNNADLSLNIVCEYLSVSVSYFSMIFKNYTGITFVEMLTRVRMEKAKKMLETTSMKNYEIANAVGYNDPHYFGAIFKKYTGKTPGEYYKEKVKRI